MPPNRIFHLAHVHNHVCPGSHSNLCSCAVLPCRTTVMGKHWPQLCVRDPWQPTINKHHVSINHELHISCLSWGDGRLTHHECKNYGEDTEWYQWDDALSWKSKKGFLLEMSVRAVCCAFSVFEDQQKWRITFLPGTFWVLCGHVCKRKGDQYLSSSILLLFAIFFLCV